MRRVAMALAAIPLALSFSACGAQDGEHPSKEPAGIASGVDNPNIEVKVVHVVVDGREIPCVMTDHYRGPSIDCDWAVAP